MCYFTLFPYWIIITMILTYAVSAMTLKSGIYFPYISFSFDHDNLK